jgi:thymidylate synthase
MQVIEAWNVNDAYVDGLRLLKDQGEVQTSRAGSVLVMPCPVTTVYERPQERVLFNSIRDANPFFHLGEALWMLAGRNDASWLDRFVKDFSSRFAEEDGIQHGAYGYRWRKYFDMEGDGLEDLPDQLETIIGLLKHNPEDRRIVLTMWDPVADLNTVANDIPCNTHAYLRVRKFDGDISGIHEDIQSVLDITVCCRSNDAVWGAYGANAVHFSILQEYLAARIGVGVGKYYQISNNFHVYTDILEKVWPVKWPTGDVIWHEDRYQNGEVEPQPLVDDPESFDEELAIYLGRLGDPRDPKWLYNNKFFSKVATPFFQAHRCWKEKKYPEAFAWLSQMPDNNDWRLAAKEWFVHRAEKLKEQWREERAGNRWPAEEVSDRGSE